MISILHVLASILIGFTITTISVFLWVDVLPSLPQSGQRGRKRQQAILFNPLFSILEPTIRVFSEQISHLPFKSIKEKADTLAKKAAYPLGLNGNDLLALSFISSALTSGVATLISMHFNRGFGSGLIIGAILGAVFPFFKIEDIARLRLLTIGRGLPPAIDLMSLSMEAGLDFIAALKQVTSKLQKENPLHFEFEYLLQKLILGWSLSNALEEMALRVNTQAVRQFTGSVIQAEKRGTPLAKVLATQAKVLRNQRSQAAEQAAARAAVMLLGPLMLIFIAVFIVIIGPMIIKYIRGEMF